MKNISRASRFFGLFRRRLAEDQEMHRREDTRLTPVDKTQGYIHQHFMNLTQATRRYAEGRHNAYHCAVDTYEARVS